MTPRDLFEGADDCLKTVLDVDDPDGVYCNGRCQQRGCRMKLDRHGAHVPRTDRIRASVHDGEAHRAAAAGATEHHYYANVQEGTLINKRLLIITALILLMSVNAAAADPDKIVVLDFKQLVEQSAAGKAAQQKIIANGEQIKSAQEADRSELMEMQERFKQESLLWTDQQKSEKARLFQSKVNELKRRDFERKKRFEQDKNKLLNEIKRDVMALVEKRAQQKGYYLVIEKRSGEVYYSATAADITGAILTEFEKAPSKQ